MYGTLQTWMARAAMVSAVIIVMFIGWAPAPEGFILATAAAVAWCRWAEEHPSV